MPISNDAQAQEQKGRLLGGETRAAVKAELDLILAAPAFSQSMRCKSFLRHVVLNALAGNTDQLKERIIGVTVFDRPNDFNTGGDSIVRVTANEVRKRISQFYQESKVAHSVQIDLPRGSYVPEFRIHPAEHNPVITEVVASGDSEQEHEVKESSPEPEPRSSAFHPGLPASKTSEAAIIGASDKRGALALLTSVSLLVVLLGAVAITYGIVRTREKKPAARIWGAFLAAKTPVLLALGTHDISDPNAQSSSAKDQFYNLILHREIVPIDDVEVLTSIEKLLAKNGIAYRVVAAEQVSLADLQKQPVVLIGAAGNQWTLRLTQGLRYRIRVDRPAGPNQAPLMSIVDSDEPGSVVWKLDFSVPMDRWKHDYAIVAREDDASIGVPVLVIAGLGNFGNLAASEVIASNALAQKLTNDGACKEMPNFEAVIGADITDARAGPPQILRETCW